MNAVEERYADFILLHMKLEHALVRMGYGRFDAKNRIIGVKWDDVAKKLKATKKTLKDLPGEIYCILVCNPPKSLESVEYTLKWADNNRPSSWQGFFRGSYLILRNNIAHGNKLLQDQNSNAGRNSELLDAGIKFIGWMQENFPSIDSEPSLKKNMGDITFD